MLQTNRFSAPAVFNAKKRMRLVVGIMLLAPLLITGRLCYLQLFRHEEYLSKAERAIYNSLAEDRLRGGIYDVNGHSLAESVRTHSCGIVKRYVKDKDATITFLSETLGISKNEINKKWNNSKNFFFVAKKIKPDVYMQLAAVRRKALGQGMELTPEYERIHPFGKSALDLLGEANSKNVGLSGIEQMYNEELTQDISKKRARRSARGEVIYDRHLKEKINVGNVYLTIDQTAQFYAERALKNAVEKNSPERAVALVQDPNTGNILAAASYPQKDGQSLAFQFTYEPGSTFKIVTSLAYLREHPKDYEDYTFTCKGRVSEGDNTISCYHGEKHGSLDLYKSFAKSCNSSYANIGLSVKQSTYNDVLKDLMFNDRLPEDFLYSRSKAKYKDNMSKGDVMQLAIGQGATAVSPMHMNMITAAIANNGTLMKPHVIKQITTADNKIVESYGGEEYKRLMSEEEARILTGMMTQVVEKGTASKLKGLSYTAAGKTGSAEFNSSKSDSHAWFTGFAPAEDPQICITVIVEDAGSGGSFAVPIAKRVFDAYFGIG